MLRTGPSTSLRTGIVHAFSGSRQQAEEFIGLGFRLGFGGAMTYPRATRLRELAATLPLGSIVLENRRAGHSTRLPRTRRTEQTGIPAAHRADAGGIARRDAGRDRGGDHGERAHGIARINTIAFIIAPCKHYPTPIHPHPHPHR